MFRRLAARLAILSCLAVFPGACASAGMADDTSGADLSAGPADLSVGPGPGDDLRQGGGGDLRRPADLRQPGDMRPAPPDLAPACQVVPQGGCGTGMKCTTHDSVSTLCDPIPMSPTPRAQMCSLIGSGDSCGAGDICIDEGMMQSRCRHFCRGDGDCGAGSFCDLPLGKAMPAKFDICTEPCNPIFPGSGCPMGRACYVYDMQHTNCFLPGANDEGQGCSSTLDCQKGMACIGPTGLSVCRRVCKLGDGGPCKPNMDCYPGGVGGWTDYSVCCPIVMGMVTC